MIEDKIRNTIQGKLDVMNLNIEDIRLCRRGTINQAYEIATKDHEYIFRITRKDSDKAFLEANASFMNYFSQFIPVPKIYLSGQTEDFPNGFMLMDKCKGSLIADSPDKLTNKVLDSLCYSINIISSTDPSKVLSDKQLASMSGKNFLTQGAFYAQFMDMVDATSKILHEINSEFYKYSKIIGDSMRTNPILLSTDKTKLSHNDLTAENTFSDGNLTGIIDFDFMCMGDPDFDKHYNLVHFMNLGVEKKYIDYGFDRFFQNKHIDTDASMNSGMCEEACKDKGVFISQFVALQKIMVLRKRIALDPDKKSKLVDETRSFLEQFIIKNPYEAMLYEH